MVNSKYTEKNIRQLLCFLQGILRNGIILDEVAGRIFSQTIHPRVLVFAHQPVASIHHPLKKTVFAHRIKGILRAAGDEMTAGAVGRGDHFLMKTDHRFSKFPK